MFADCTKYYGTVPRAVKMGRIPILKPRKVATPGTFPEEARKKSSPGKKTTPKKSTPKKATPKKSTPKKSTPGQRKGRPKKKGSSRKDNYR